MNEIDSRSLTGALVGDGRFLLVLSGSAVVFSGGFAILQALSGQFLPHDALALGMDAAALARRVGNRHLVHFMFHDRVAFGGTLLAVGFCYAWLAEFPLRAGEAWAWWSLACSGAVGFASFLAYLGYGYLDKWHAVATLFLLPAFSVGLWRSRQSLPEPLAWRQMFRAPVRSEPGLGWWGRRLLLTCAGGLALAGITIVFVGMTFVFVPQDLAFMGLTAEQILHISPRLVPVIAHDRAGFGGGLCSTGLLVGFIAWHAPLTRSFVEIMLLMGVCGFGAALGVHFAIGYLNFVHLAPAYLGFGIFLSGVLFCWCALRRALAIERLSNGRGVSPSEY
jgi:hypothetical protein